METITLRTRYNSTGDVRIHVTLTVTRVGHERAVTRAKFRSIIDVMDYADETDHYLLGDGWERA
ncbi:hypothetical protein [Streptomyces sp. NPDC055036]